MLYDAGERRQAERAKLDGVRTCVMCQRRRFNVHSEHTLTRTHGLQPRPGVLGGLLKLKLTNLNDLNKVYINMQIVQQVRQIRFTPIALQRLGALQVGRPENLRPLTMWIVCIRVFGSHEQKRLCSVVVQTR